MGAKLTKTEYLKQRYSGEWTYNRRKSCWECDDGRHVAKTVSIADGGDGYAYQVPAYYLYDGDKTPERVSFVFMRSPRPLLEDPESLENPEKGKSGRSGRSGKAGKAGSLGGFSRPTRNSRSARSGGGWA